MVDEKLSQWEKKKGKIEIRLNDFLNLFSDNDAAWETYPRKKNCENNIPHYNFSALD